MNIYSLVDSYYMYDNHSNSMNKNKSAVSMKNIPSYIIDSTLSSRPDKVKSACLHWQKVVTS